MFKPFKFIIDQLYNIRCRFSTYYKVREIAPQLRESLNLEERRFYLEMHCALHGDNLVIYDIGASKGILCSALAKLKNVASIYAFEPIPTSYAVLAKSMALHDHVTCLNLAVGNESSLLNMHVIDSDFRRDSSSLLAPDSNGLCREFGGDFSSHTKAVEVVKLDVFVSEKKIPKPDVVILDVQGYEAHVINGGKNTILAAQFVVIEINLIPLYQDSADFDSIYNLMKEMGFAFVCLTGAYQNSKGYTVQFDAVFEKTVGHQNYSEGNL
jgi:FkbM family methyltransferase